MAKIIERAKKFARTFPRKHHVEYITALLSIPVLLSVIALNYFNLQNTAKKEEPTAPVQNEKPVVIITGGSSQNSTPLPTNTPVCKKEVGPITISYPEENQIAHSSPVCFTIRYEDEDYCSVVWSYRINESEWSDYNSNAPCLYNLPDGDIKFELRVQSTVSQDTETIERNFKYLGPSATPSAAPEQ
jgi:hypothetical protein